MSEKLLKNIEEDLANSEEVLVDIEESEDVFDAEDFDNVEDSIESKNKMRDLLIKILEENNNLLSTTKDVDKRIRFKEYLEKEIERYK